MSCLAENQLRAASGRISRTLCISRAFRISHANSPSSLRLRAKAARFHDDWSLIATLRENVNDKLGVCKKARLRGPTRIEGWVPAKGSGIRA